MGEPFAGTDLTARFGVVNTRKAQVLKNVVEKCKRRSKNVALAGACVTAEKRGALEPTRRRVSKACNEITVTSLTPPRGSRECTRIWKCGVKCAARC